MGEQLGVASYFMDLENTTKPEVAEGMKSFLEIHQILQEFAVVINFVKGAISLAKFGGDLLVYGLASEKLIQVMQKHAYLFSKVRTHMHAIYKAMRSYLDEHIIMNMSVNKDWQINQASADGHYLNLFSGSDCMFCSVCERC
eukprot:TRINITY_DN6425_c0_g1_i1.p1 TRINITY_DN6425_c0_g1~~TRINITY_DN6425_c0_g1_i1.p1  ORF type:complete len:142 (+),score=21.11 TRINITY_DN6425_c0_g1_i1:162-587(+)